MKKIKGNMTITVNGKKVAEASEITLRPIMDIDNIYELHSDTSGLSTPIFRCVRCGDEWMVSTSKTCLNCGSNEIARIDGKDS